MKKKPLLYGKRFFNCEKDSALRRIKSVLKSGLCILKEKVKRRVPQEFYNVSKEWKTTVEIPQVSIKPIITWIGHATFLIQIGGLNILTDPIFFEMSRFFHPRIVEPALKPEELPKIDIIMVSHNHIDHLDHASILAIKKQNNNPLVLVPHGNKYWFTSRGFSRVFEKNWWEEHPLTTQDGQELVFYFLPASHWSGRNLFDTNKTLWGSWIIEYNKFKIYFAGDTAYAEHFEQISKAHPNIDVALMPIAPNDPSPHQKISHVDTPEAFKAFCELKAQNFIPMHWGTFVYEEAHYEQPIRLLKGLWKKHKDKLNGKILQILKFGQSSKFSI